MDAIDDEAIARFLDQTMPNVPDLSEPDISFVFPEILPDLRDPLEAAQEGK